MASLVCVISECASTPRCDEPTEKILEGGAAVAAPDAAARSQQQAQTKQRPPQLQQQPPPIQQSRAGECNLLPVLVERLRSALELSCSSQSSEDQLPLEDSGVDSEEDFRLWTTGLGGASNGLDHHEQQQQQQQVQQVQQQQQIDGKPKLDLKFLEDILLADIHTALARLQDTLKRVDIGTLTRYNASLDPSNKLYLLRLISNLLSKLKVPEDAILQPSEPETRNAPSSHALPRRRKTSERHTISVSAEEIARARRWLEEKSSNESSPRVELEREIETERIVEGAPSAELTEISAERNSLDNPSVIEAPMTYDKSAFNDKCMKDAINQQQSLQIKNNREIIQNKENGSRAVYDPLERVVTAPRRFDALYKDDCVVQDNFQDRSAKFYQQQQSTAPTRYNKFTAKKSKIKRANTIDIPNYLKLQSESQDQIQNGCFSLRRPIGVGDRVNGYQRVVPSFEPKTENDRKFLALISKNTEGTTNVVSSSPFKTFNYRQPSTVAPEKNWNSRFSNIKTTFDKPRDNEEEYQRKPGKLDIRKKFENIRENSLEKEGMLVGSVKVPLSPQKHKQNGFTHAPTSPFQKIEKTSPNPESVPPFLKAGHMPKNNSMLQAKLKMFDQEAPKPSAHINAAKNKFGKPPENNTAVAQPMSKQTQDKKISSQPIENGHLNYYSFCKQFAPFASGRTNSSEGKSYVDSTKSKLLTNLTKETDKPSEIKRDNPKPAHLEHRNSIPKLEIHDNRHDFTKQYSYHKPYDVYSNNEYHNPKEQQSLQNYRQLDKKPQFNNTHGNFQTIQENQVMKPEKPPRKFEAATQNVAVQTTLESTDRRPSEPELINSMADHLRNHPVPQPRKLLTNVSVQTTSPSIISPIPYNTTQNYLDTSTSPSIVSPIPHAETYQYNQPSVSVPSSVSDYTPYQHPPTDNPPQNYYNTNYVPDQSQNQSGHYVYPTSPYYPQTTDNYTPPTNTQSTNYSTEQSRHGISQKLYNQFSKLPDNRNSSIDDYSKDEDSTYSTPAVPYEDTQVSEEVNVPYKPAIRIFEDTKLPDLVEENIQNQDISSDGVVTRYTCAIATVSSSPEPNPEPHHQELPPQSYEPVIPRIKEPQQRHYAETTSYPTPAERKSLSESLDEIQRHNMLQQSLIRRMQSEHQQHQHQHQQVSEKIPSRRFSQEIGLNERRSPTSPSFNSANYPGRVCALKALTESHKAQEKISMFEEKNLSSKQLFRPLNVPPKMSVVNPATVLRNERSPIRNNASSPIDSSDEYLMSCASKPTRNLVLSKSESWHQLAMAKTAGGLQLPQPSSGAESKPPKPKSPSSLRLSKQFEASLASDSARKMEEKIQRYFQGSSTGVTHAEELKQTSRRESKSKRVLHSKKNSSMNSLMRSHTMPHLYDERLFDDSVDVDQAFDSIFKEATRSDNRH